jgi:DNA replication and repair protein RecF
MTWFRNYETLRLDIAGAPVVVLAGDNGAGKTNILEAVSLLTPGKGLRGADLLEMKSRRAGPEEVWGISAEVETADGLTARLGTALAREKKKRLVRINGKDAKSQNELTSFISAVWLMPALDRIFLESASLRRKFFDRLVYAFEPEHVTRLNRYDRNLRERMALLQNDRIPDARWLDSLEEQLVLDAVPIAASRHHMAEKLSAQARELKKRESLFPSPTVSMNGFLEENIGDMPALELEEALRQKFRQSRVADRESGKSHEGIHRSDMDVMFLDKKMPAAQCSTGEQKGLLISIMLSHALLMRGEKGFTPLLLLDEVAAHLDDARQKQLFSFIEGFKGQVWMTGTDAALFKPLMSRAAVFHVADGHARRERSLRAVDGGDVS